MVTRHDDPPAEAAPDGPSTDVGVDGVDAMMHQTLVRSRELRARSHQLRAKGERLRQAPAERRSDEPAHDIDLAGSQRWAQAAVERARVRPATALDRLDRGGAAPQCSAAQRAPVEIDSPASLEGERALVRQAAPRNLGVHIERAKELRKQLAAAAAALARAEEEVARTHEKLAGSPAQVSEYRGIAESARTMALHARDIEQQFRS